MKTKKVLSLVLTLALVIVLVATVVACDRTRGSEFVELTLEPYSVVEPDYSSLVFPADFKIGLICLHDKNSTYDKNFIEAMEEAQRQLGLTDEQVIIVTGVPEGDACYQKAKELAQLGCSFIFANSFGHEPFLLKAAKEFPNVQFCHATGTKAHTEKLDNFINAFASIYEGRYLAGIAAGMKLNEMIANGEFSAAEAKMGYVGAFTYAEVISGYSSFYLGAKSVCPSVTMDVTFTGSWYDETKEYNAAKKLIAGGCKLISQHADSMGAPNACEESGVPNISYNGSTGEACPDTFIVSSRINWTPFYKYAIATVAKGEKLTKNGYDFTGTIKDGSVVLTNVGGNAAAEGTVAAIVEARNKLAEGTLNVFDCSKFSIVKGEYDDVKLDAQDRVTSFNADVDDMGDYVPETQVVSSGVIYESKFRSAPYFNLQIKGITLLDTIM